ncbi:MAG: hypothetical protein MR966_03140 [Lachnospiraceae bacterium]|nr:hypothetical protein [Lachnospiraceae bacterium]
MFNRLFGESDKEKMEFLEVRVPVSLVLVILSIVISAFAEEATMVIALLGYYWAWELIKRWFGVASIFTLIAGMKNIVLGVIVGLAFLIVGYFCGLITLLLATICYISLKMSKHS